MQQTASLAPGGWSGIQPFSACERSSPLCKPHSSYWGFDATASRWMATVLTTACLHHRMAPGTGLTWGHVGANPHRCVCGRHRHRRNWSGRWDGCESNAGRLQCAVDGHDVGRRAVARGSILTLLHLTSCQLTSARDFKRMLQPLWQLQLVSTFLSRVPHAKHGCPCAITMPEEYHKAGALHIAGCMLLRQNVTEARSAWLQCRTWQGML